MVALKKKKTKLIVSYHSCFLCSKHLAVYSPYGIITVQCLLLTLCLTLNAFTVKQGEAVEII